MSSGVMIKQLKKMFFLFVLPVCLMLLCYLGKAQEGQAPVIVKGKVIDSAGNPIESLTVKLKGTTVSTATNKLGAFTIKILANIKNPKLTFLSVGFGEKEIEVGNNLNPVIKLQSYTSKLDEVVVVNIGYGTVRKKDLTGSIGRVNMEDLQKASVKSFDDALGGRVAGVQVTSNDGQPGANAEIVIRGVGSVTQSSSPLYVVDGFPQEDGNFNSINPAEIESIEVLKDASSTAIYGARGANGVIIVTTRRGKAPTPVIDYNSYYGSQKVIKKMELMNPYEYVKLQNDINPAWANLAYFNSGKTQESYKNVPGVNWQDLTFNKSPIFQNHYLSVSSKANKTAYTISGSYTDLKGLILNSGFWRYQSRITIDQEINPKLKIGTNVNYAYTNSYGVTPSGQNTPINSVVNSSQFNFMTSLWSYRPVSYANALNDNFVDNLIDLTSLDFGIADNRINPYIGTLNTNTNNYTNHLSANGYLNYKFTDELIFRSTIGISLLSTKSENFNNSNTASGSPYTNTGKQYGLSGSVNNAQNNNLVNENTLSYAKKINQNHLINAVIGYTWQINNTGGTGILATNLPNESLGIKGLGQGIANKVSSPSGHYGLVSYLGRVNYSLMRNYLFTFSMRADGSSKFAPNRRWGYFESGAFAWNFGNENFMRRFKYISDAKFRMSLGVTGNNRVPNTAYEALLNTGGTVSMNEATLNGIIATSGNNPNLKWETIVQNDFGLDVSFLEGKINVEMDYYRKLTKNMLSNANVAYSTGYARIYENIGSLRNEGLELSISTVNVTKKNFKWTSSFNISFNKNRILSLVDNQEAILTARSYDASVDNFPNFIAKVGKPAAQFFGLVSDGNYQYSDFYKLPNGTNGFFYVLKENIPYYASPNSIAAPNSNPALVVQPGDPKFKDLNHDGIIDNTPSKPSDYTVIGNPYPIHFGGVTNNFIYKDFDLNIFMQWSYGNQIMNANRMKFEGGNSGPATSDPKTGNINNNMFATYANRWTPTNPSNDYYRVNAQTGGTRQYTSRIIEDGSYLRVKTVAFGYTIPSNIIRRIGISSVRMYLSAQNLFTFTHYTGTDPEVSTLSGNNLTPGFDFSPYPRTKVVTFGVNVKF
ncbi:SusC/RagA family TonB-linked outer membrane protein [Parasediminibacterium sp. JCM 36343]|uniref:SusC/RagA family TonB-linked outer membrane protein n=1 Tax=Parasediminibacterium sp. JCM 36343 TaxID=3374279 RepID=UPI00397DC8C1